jgi:hypothetical protein
MLPDFTSEGYLPAADYELTFEELRSSTIVVGPSSGSPNWDRSWRRQLVENLAILVDQLWQVGIDDIFIDGSFVEDKEHPNDTDGYFVCDLMELASGRLETELNLLDPYKVWTWDPASRRPYRGYPKRQLPMACLPCRVVSACGSALGDPRQARKRVGVPFGLSTFATGWRAERHRQDHQGGQP